MAKEIKTMQEPSLDEIVRVGTTGFGFINRQTKEKWLETIMLNYCVAVHFNFRGGLQVLTHAIYFDANFYIQTIFSHLETQGLTRGRHLKEVTIVYSGANDPSKHSPPLHQDIAKRNLRHAGVHSSIKLLQTPDHAVLFDRNGRPYWLNDGKFKSYDGEQGMWKFPASPNNGKDGLAFDNTGEWVTPTEGYQLPNSLKTRSISNVVKSLVGKV